MKYLFSYHLSFACLVLFVSCQARNEKPLTGEWRWFNPSKDTYYDSLYNPPPISDMRYHFPGLRFISGDSLENPTGFFDYKSLSTSEEEETGELTPVYLGLKTIYQRTDNLLSIYDRTDSIWRISTIVKQNKDTLVLKDDEGCLAWYVNTEAQPKFDAISIASSGCFGSCPVTKILFFPDGQVISYAETFTKQLGFLQAKIDTTIYQQMVARFNKVPIMNLKARYEISATDHNTVTVSFVQNGRIVKTISDYGFAAPAQFVWAYQHALNNSTLFTFKLFEPQFSPVLSGYLEETGGKKIRTSLLYESEAFLFWYYLDKAKPITPSQNNLPYKFHFSTSSYFMMDSKQESLTMKIPNNQQCIIKEINTDGRFVEFFATPKKRIWLDMGINILERSQILRFRFLSTNNSDTERYFILENY